MKLSTLKDLYKNELKDLYSAETQLINALPRMAQTASSRQLRNAFNEHLEQTKEHARRIERLFDNLDVSPTGRKCKGVTTPPDKSGGFSGYA
jgi:ferritin-like metal-binding protein YciE